MNYLVRGVDFLFHLAGQVSHVMSLNDPFPDIDINIGGTTVVLEALRGNHVDAKVIFSSTRGAYGPVPKLPDDEEQSSNPVALHEISKLTAELIFKAYLQQHGIRSTMLRFTNTYGPRSQMRHGKYGVVNYFIRRAMDGDVIQVFGDGSVLRDYLFVSDAVDALILAAEDPAADGVVYNVGWPSPTSLADLVKAVIEAAGSGHRRFAPYSEERKAQEPGDFYSDITRISTALGWEPKVGLSDGLRRTVEYCREHRDAYWGQA
jgi:UDP-glucose 4-epimerase